MNILALDTATGVFSAALLTETGTWYTEINAGSRHSELLMECIDGLFKLASLAPADLKLVTCMKGPGSFTGLRIGFSTAKGLSMAQGIPLVSVPTLDCMAHSLSIWPGIIIPLIDAKKGCFFSALYRGSLRLTNYFDLPPENITDEAEKTKLFADEPIILTGPGADLFFSRLPPHSPFEHVVVSPESKRGKAWELLEIAKSAKIEDMGEIDSGPIYLRKSDAELNRQNH